MNNSQTNKTQKENSDTLKTNKTAEEILNQISKQNVIYKRIGDWIIIPGDSTIKKKPTKKHELDYENKLNHAIINNIQIISLSCFARNIKDISYTPRNALESRLNKLRFPTQKSIILKSLFFKKGELVNLQNLKDSERLLRSHSNISDARISLEPASSDSTLANVYVYIQDKYPYGANIKLSDDGVNLNLYSKNVLGYGIELHHTISSISTENRSYGIGEKLIWDNIYGTYINLNTCFYDVQNSNSYNLKLDKEFYKSDVKYAGGFSLTRNYRITTTNFENDIINNNLDYFKQEYWLGKSILLSTTNYFNRSNICIMGQSIVNQYHNLPDTITDIPEFTTNYYIFGGLSFYKQNFYKNNTIFSFGRTEDVPYGFLSTLTVGYNKNSIDERFFFGAHFSFGKAIIPNKGYYSFSADFQSFYNKKEPFNEVIKIQNQYISHLIKVNNSNLRYFIYLNYVKGIHFNKYHQLYLNENSLGLALYQENRLKGNEKLIFQNENVLFTPKQILGFKIAAFNFFDIGWISQNSFLLKTKPYYSLGAGIRIKNEHLVFKTIQVQFAYFPRIPPGGTNVNFRISGIETNSFNQLNFDKPYTDIYQ